MVSSLIEQAKSVLSALNPDDEQLEQAESGLSTYLEALATNRIADQVSTDELEEANRLLRELRRERSRRAAGPAAATPQPDDTIQQSTPFTNGSGEFEPESPSVKQSPSPEEQYG